MIREDSAVRTLNVTFATTHKFRREDLLVYYSGAIVQKSQSRLRYLSEKSAFARSVFKIPRPRKDPICLLQDGNAKLMNFGGFETLA